MRRIDWFDIRAVAIDSEGHCNGLVAMISASMKAAKAVVRKRRARSGG